MQIRNGLLMGLLFIASVAVEAAVTMNATIHRISDNVEEIEITWPAIALPAGWIVASHYIRVNANMTSIGDGIQIYTDNTAGDANPLYIGTIDSVSQTPAGLVNTALPTL